MPSWDNLTLTTWNAQALMAVDALRHSAKWKLLQGLMKDSAVVGLQETHALDIELLDAATAFAATHK